MAVPEKKSEPIDGYEIKYHADGLTRWSKGRVEEGQPVGYWEWYRKDGSLKRSGHWQRLSLLQVSEELTLRPTELAREALGVCRGIVQVLDFRDGPREKSLGGYWRCRQYR